jgi:outer membrane lipoprotein SlyB
MRTQKTNYLDRQLGRIHPLVATAAVAVTTVSLVGIAAITGVIPTSHSTVHEPATSMASVATVANPTNGVAVQQPAAKPTQLVSASPNYIAAPASNTASTVNHAPAPAHTPTYAQHTHKVQPPAVCHSCGRVESVTAIREPASGSGIGVATGAVLGGLLGNQVGNGNGRTLATVAGAVAGGFGGNEVEKRVRSTTAYQVHVRMEDGQMRTFPQNGPNGWQVGDRVKVVNDALTSRG